MSGMAAYCQAHHTHVQLYMAVPFGGSITLP